MGSRTVRPLVHGLRAMLRRPLVSLTSIVCLAVGTAASATSWMLIEAAILRPYGLHGSDRLVVVWETDPARNQPLIEVSWLNFLDWQRESRTVEAMAAIGSQHWPALARIGGEMVPLATRGVSESFFAVLGVHPRLGRRFAPDDGRPDAPRPIILSDRLWRTRFAGAPVVGDALFLNGIDHIVIGVMPPGFAYPDDPDAWVSVERVLGEAFQSMPEDQQRRVGVLEVIARRTPAASNDDVRAELSAVVQTLQRRHAPAAVPGTTTVAVTPFADVVVGRLGSRLWIALGMSLAVLLLACANVAAARRAHLKERAGEIGMRLSLGGTRGRVVRDLAIESLPLTAAGVLAAAALWIGLETLLAETTTIRASGLILRDHRLAAVGVLAALAVCAWVAAGLAPAAAAVRASQRGMVHGGQRIALRTSRIGAPLMFGQAVLAVVVIALATAALQTFRRLSDIDLGFAMRGVTLVDFALPGWKYDSPGDARQTVDRLQAALRTLGGVDHVAGVSIRPFRFGEIGDGLPVRRTGDALVQPDEATAASRVAVTDEYFSAMGQRILAGRTFTAADGETTEPVVILSRTLARALFGETGAVGQRIDTFTLSEKWRSRLVVGVAGDAQYRGLERPSMEVYTPAGQSRAPIGTLVLSAGVPLTAETVRRALVAVEPDLAIQGIRTTGDVRAEVLSPARLLTTVVGGLGISGALLLALGIFAAAAASLRAAWAEIAVRQAIGARPWQAASAPLVLLTRALGSGVAVGLVLSPGALAAAARLGVSPSSAPLWPLAGAAAVALAVAALAILPSLLRATKAPPAELLRSAGT